MKKVNLILQKRVKLFKFLISLILFFYPCIVFAGGPFDHSFVAFQCLNKPLKDIVFTDHVLAIISHVMVDASIAENGKNLIFYQGFFSWAATQKAKQAGRALQYKMAYFEGNLVDMIDKGLTGGAIRSQIAQIPFIGEIASYMIPSVLSHDLIHSVSWYPKPSYSMTEGQYLSFQLLEFALFYTQLEAIKIKGNKIALGVNF